MKIAYNPKTAAALTSAPANNDITFDLSGLSIYVKGVRFKGTDTTYSVFKKHGSNNSGGYDGLVPVPNYNSNSKNRYLREDGTWLLVAVTDLNVLLSETTATQYRPIVLGLTYDTSVSNLAKSVTGLVYVTTKMYALPSTGYLYASKLFSGGREVLTEHLSLANYVTLKTNLTITGVKTFSTLLKFTVGLGTSPFTVTSTTKVTNLNADLLDGLHSSSFSLVNHTHNYLSPVASIGSSTKTHAEALKDLFTNNKSNIPRNVLINYYSSSYGNGSLYFGYFINGYDSNPYGGFYVAHYDTPYYVGISNGTFTQWALSKVGHTHAGLTFRKTDGTNVTYNGSTAIDLSSGIYYSNNSGYATRLDGGATASWGTLTTANGYTGIAAYDWGAKGAFAWAGKGGQMSMLIDGFFYLNEGKYRVLDTSDKGGLFTSFINAGSLTTSITIGGTTRTLKIDSDTVDGWHASGFTKFYISPLSGSAPADSAKTWFSNTMPSGMAAIVYNVPGSEKTIIVGKSTGPHGHMLLLSYDDRYLRLLRYKAGNWQSTDWEKIYAGYADSAGTTLNIRVDQYSSTGDYPVIWADSASSNSNSNTISRLYKTWKSLYWTPNTATLTSGLFVSSILNTWLNPARVLIGRINTTVYSDRSVVGTTDGNLHLDPYSGKDIYLNYYTGTYGMGHAMLIKSNGYVGIGVVPLQKLHVDGIVRISSSGCAHLYLKADSDVVDLYSIIRFGINGNDNASYIFQNGPKRTGDGGANAMTIRNNVGILRLQNRVHIDSTGRIYPEGSSSRRTGMYGVYDSTKIGHIWSMGTSYMIPDDGSTFGNLYGLAYKHTNNSTGGTMAGGHLVVWCDAGNPKVSLGYNGVWASGGFYKNGSSDSYVLLGGGGHKAISDFATSGHTHPYLPLSGGWMDAETKIYFRGANGSTSAYTYMGYNASLSGLIMHCAGNINQTKGFYIASNGYESGNDWGGIAIDNEGVTVFGAGDGPGNGSTLAFTGIFRVLNEDNVGDGPQFLVTKASGVVAKRSMTASNFISNVATGTQPYACTSTTVNTNLNADMLDGYHASGFVKFYLSPMTSSAPADSAKSWFLNTMPSGSGAIVYNVPGSEKTIIAGKSTGSHGHMLQLNYDDTYLRILRYKAGSWISDDWEKISAGYADSAGNANSSGYTNYLNSISRMDYGWNGINYFNANLTAGCAAKVNDSPTSAWWHILRFNHYNSSGYYTDLAIPFSNNSLYWKTIRGGSVSYSSWVKVLDSLNYNEYAPTKTGGGASGTWGISITGNAATASKLGTSTVGATNIPIYLNSGTPTVVNLNSTANNLINNLTTGTATPVDADYYISQSVGGGTTTTTYHRRPHSALYAYIKGKAEGTWNISINGNAKGLSNNGILDSQEKIDNFLTANKLEYAIFKTVESNNVGLASNDGMILSIPWGSTYYGAQMAFDDTLYGTVKVRCKSSSWGNWYTLLHSGNYTNYVNTTNFPGLNKVGTVTSVTVTGSNGLSGTGTITTSGTITLSNSGVRSTTINGEYLQVNTNGTNADLTIPFSSKTNKMVSSKNLDTVEKANDFRDTTYKSLLCAYLGNSVFEGITDGILLSASVPGEWCHQIHFDDNQVKMHHRSRYSNSAGWSPWYLILDSLNSSVSGGGNTGGSSMSVKIANTIATLTIPTSLPASDVYEWAKQSTKPSYSFSEITSGVATIGDGANRVMFRTNASYKSGMYYSTPGNESMVFANVNSITSWIFATTDPTANTNWTTLTPSLQIKNGRVTINKLIASGTNASYNLDVNGSANATTIYENGVRVSVSGHTHTKAQITDFPSSLPANGGDADTVDGKHATDFLGWSSRQSIGSGSPFQDAVNFFNNLSNLNNGGKMVYNSAGAEYTELFTRRNDSTAHGTILKWGYADKYIRIIRMISGAARSTDWEKISAGYADTAGNADTTDGVHIEWSGSQAASDTTWIVGWNTNGTKLKAVKQADLSVNYATSAGSASKVTVTDSTTAYKILYANGTGSLSIYRLTATIGGAAKPIYISGGVPTACSSTVGNSRLPVYLSSGTITESPYSFYGSDTQPIVLVAGRIYRSSNTAASNDWSFSGYKHESVGNLNSTPSISGGVARFTFNSVSGKTYYFIGAVVNHGTSSEVTSATSGDYGNVRSDGLYWFGTYVSDPYIYIRACCNADNNNDSTQSREGAWKNWSGAVLSFSIIIIGRATSS